MKVLSCRLGFLLSTALFVVGLSLVGASEVEAADYLMAGYGGTMTFGQVDKPLKEWRIAIVDVFKRAVYEVRGFDSLPPTELVWDGNGNDGRPLAYDPDWRRSTSFIQYDGTASHGLGYLRMVPEDPALISAEESYRSEIVTSNLPSDQGGRIIIQPPHTYGGWMRWYFSIADSDGKVVYQKQWQSFEDQYISYEPFVLEWDGKTNEGRTAGDGQYVMSFETEVIDSHSMVHRRQDTADLTVGIRPGSENELGDEDADEASQSAACTDRNPVLLIHGLNSYPSMWLEKDTDYVGLLESWGYPRRFVGLYNYSGQGSGKNGYNNQGGVVEVAQGMREAVISLSELSLSCGGSGQIDIVAHSMGGLVARQYIADYQSNSMIDKVISVGTPYQGSWLLGWKNNEPAEKPVQWLMSVFSDSVGALSPLGQIKIDSDAYEDLSPKSRLLLDLFAEPAPSRLTALYGSIKAGVEVELFNISLKSIVHDLGDLVVLSNSGSIASHQSSNKSVAYGSSGNWLSFSMELGLSGYYYAAKGSPSVIFKYSHSQLLSQGEVQEKIFDILTL